MKWRMIAIILFAEASKVAILPSVSSFFFVFFLFFLACDYFGDWGGWRTSSCLFFFADEKRKAIQPSLDKVFVGLKEATQTLTQAVRYSKVELAAEQVSSLLSLLLLLLFWLLLLLLLLLLLFCCCYCHYYYHCYYHYHCPIACLTLAERQITAEQVCVALFVCCSVCVQIFLQNFLAQLSCTTFLQNLLAKFYCSPNYFNILFVLPSSCSRQKHGHND